MVDSMYSPTAAPLTTVLSTSSEPVKRWRPLALNVPQETDPVFCVRNTFIDTVEQLSPSLAGFYHERHTRTCPAVHMGRLRSHLENRVAGAEELQHPFPDEAGALPPLHPGSLTSAVTGARSGSSDFLDDAVSDYCTPRSVSCRSPAFSSAEVSTEWMSPCSSLSSPGASVRLDTADMMPTLLVSARSPASAAHAETRLVSKLHGTPAPHSIGSASQEKGPRRASGEQKRKHHARRAQKSRR